MRGVSIILHSQSYDFISQFSTDIGIYYLKIDEDQNEKLIFEYNEKAFKNKKMKATINNYGVCFMKRIGVNQDYAKVKEIFAYGIELNDSNSMYH